MLSSTGLPSVSVPVLSNTTCVTCASRSVAVEDFNSIPLRNSRPEAAVVTAGTARPSAQGQVMISTATAMLSDSRTSQPEITIQAMNAPSDSRCTAGA